MKKILCFILVTLLTLSAIGCNGSGNNNQTEEGKTVVVVYEADKASYWNDIKQEYETKFAAEGYKINLIPVGGGQVEGKQNTMISQGNAPDLILGGDVHILNQYKNLMPLNELIAQDAAEVDYEDFIPEITEKLEYNNNIYYLPEFFNVSVLYYNKDIFDSYNISEA